MLILFSIEHYMTFRLNFEGEEGSRVISASSHLQRKRTAA